MDTPRFLSEDVRGQARIQYSGHRCTCGSTGHSLQRCLAALKVASPSSTSNSERTILTDSCLKHGNHACAHRVSAFSRSRQVNCRRNTPRSGRFRYFNQERNSSSLGNYGGTVVAANHVGALVQPARQTLSAPSYAASAALSAIIIGLHSQVIQTRARASTARPRYNLNPLLDGLETVMPHP